MIAPRQLPQMSPPARRIGTGGAGRALPSAASFVAESGEATEMDGPEMDTDIDGGRSTRIEGPGKSSSLSSLSCGGEAIEMAGGEVGAVPVGSVNLLLLLLPLPDPPSALSSIVEISARPDRLSKGDAICCGWTIEVGSGVHRGGGLRRDREFRVPLVRPWRGGGLRGRDG
jgi:hypothetical protein